MLVDATAIPGDSPPRLNLRNIEAAIRAVQADFDRINGLLSDWRDPMGEAVVVNLIAGYRFVEALVGAGVDLLAMGNLRQLIELNTLVLCGTDAQARREAADHLKATEERFYEQEEGGIRDIVEWYDLHRVESVWQRAAGVYIRAMSEPQLFIEGNHRTGALIMSYILMREGRPPFVLSIDNARAFFDPSSLVKKIKRRSIRMRFKMPGLRKALAQLLRDGSDRRYLLRPDQAAG
jgi:prophage maintenance system killer protein